MLGEFPAGNQTSLLIAHEDPVILVGSPSSVDFNRGLSITLYFSLSDIV